MFICNSIPSYCIIKNDTCFETLFKAGGRLTKEEVLDFNQSERDFYFKFMTDHLAELSEKEKADLYSVRWEILTKSVYQQKWVKNIEKDNFQDYVKIFNENPDSFRDTDKIFNLCEAIKANNSRIVELLLQNKANANSFLENSSPLRLALDLDHQDCIKILMQYGARLTNEELQRELQPQMPELNFDNVPEDFEDNQDQDQQNYLMHGFNQDQYNVQSGFLIRWIKAGELKAAKIIIANHVRLNDEQIEELTDAQNKFYNDLLEERQLNLDAVAKAQDGYC